MDAFEEKVVAAVDVVARDSRVAIALETPVVAVVQDSLDELMLLVELEKRFAFGIPDDILTGARTIAELVEKMRSLEAGSPKASRRRNGRA